MVGVTGVAKGGESRFSPKRRVFSLHWKIANYSVILTTLGSSFHYCRASTHKHPDWENRPC